MSDSDDSGDGQEVVLPPRRFARKNRGTRISELVGEEEEADSEFWGQDFFKEKSDDEMYQTESESSDVADSDFSGSESEGEAQEVEPEKKKRQKKGVYVDPSKKPAGKAPARRKKKKTDTPTEAVRKSKRSAVANTRKRKTTSTKSTKSTRKAKKPRVEKVLTQEEMLAEAAITEEYNKASLKAFLEQEEEKKVARRRYGQVRVAGPRIVFHSKEGVDTVTFTEHLPLCFYSQPRPYAPPILCAITQQPAKYVDPYTRLPYANLEAFREIRARYSR